MATKRQKSDVLAISIGPHLAYRRFMESIDADFHQVRHHIAQRQSVIGKGSGFVRSFHSIPSGYRYYISESCFYYSAAARKIGQIEGKIIDLCASPVYYYMLINRIKGFGKRVLLSLLKDVDGFLFEGSFVRDVVQKLGIDKPHALVYTYVRPDRFDFLLGVKPNLKSKNIAIIATNDYFYKGLDILLEAMKIVNEYDPEITLTIAPKNIDFAPLRHLMTPSVRINHDACATLKDTALYVHPSRGDVFPTSPLEAMLAGIPSVVSTDTGTKEVVGEIREDFVVSPKPDAVAERIIEYFCLSLKEKTALSKRFRKSAKNFNERSQVENFRKRFSLLKRSL